MSEMDEIGEIPLREEPRVTLEGLVVTFTQPLRSFFRRRVADDGKAENLIQETLLRITRSFHTLRQGTTTRAWAFAVAANLYRDFLKDEAKSPIPAENLDGRVSACPDPEQAILDREVESLLARCVQDLPEKQQRVFLMKHQHGMTYEAIGRALDISEGTAKSRMHTATLTIRERMSRRGFLAGEGKGDR